MGDRLSNDIAYLTGGVVAIREFVEIKRREKMTPKLQALPKALGMLRHSIEHDADKLYARIEKTNERKDQAFKRSHAILDATDQGIGEVEQFVEELEKATNAGPPLDDSSPSSEKDGPRSSELTDTARKVA